MNLSRIDKALDCLSRITREAIIQENNLMFIRGKFLHGTADEKRLIEAVSKLTIDHINALISDIQESARGVIG